MFTMMQGGNIFPIPSSNACAVFVPSPNLGDAASLEHMNKLFKARQAFSQNFLFATGDSHNLDKERIYHELYQDIKAHADFWFTRVFCPEMESKYAEWTLGILGTLATIRRQRGDVRACLEILKLDTKVLEVYQNIADYDNPAERECVRGLTYKYNLIVVNANSQARNREVALKAFRDAVVYEIEEAYTFEQQNFGYMLQRLGDKDEYMTMERLNSTPDELIWSTLTAMMGMSPSTVSHLPVEPKLCDYCGTEEEMCGDMMRCSACQKAFYCNKECQKLHWKTLHKPECRGKLYKKVKVGAESIKTAAKIMTNNYAETVRRHTGETVSDENKQAAFPCLVKLLKEFLLKHKEFNSGNGFSDMPRDAEFLAEVSKYFEQQRGYEDLVVIHQKPECRRHRAAVTSPDRENEVLVDDDTLLDFARGFMSQMNPHFRELGVTVETTDEIVHAVVLTLKEYMLSNPEYNSYRGFTKLKNSNEARDAAVTTITDILVRKGHVSDD